jgi:hypothetical protein
LARRLFDNFISVAEIYLKWKEKRNSVRTNGKNGWEATVEYFKAVCQILPESTKEIT